MLIKKCSCWGNGIILFSDEVYQESEYRVEDRLPAACDLGGHMIAYSTFSTGYFAPFQAKIPPESETETEPPPALMV